MSNSITANAPASIARRHDLDALRAVAMLLGIALHGAMSFIPSVRMFWAVQDTQGNELFGVLLAAVHGFRMPLFFLISGFFTAMLWRKRGLEALVLHRFMRIFLPMAVALFTIIPATWIVSAYVKADGNKVQPGNVANERSGSVDEAKPLNILAAAMSGDVESVKLCIEQDVDVETKGDDGSTALHVAVFFGRAEVTKLLLDAGADTNARNNKGERPADVLQHPWGITKFIADLLSVEIEEDELHRGRKQIAELFDERGIVVPEGVRGGNELWGLVQLAMYFPLFGHLWFLWFLCWLVAGFSLCVMLGKSFGIQGPPAWMTLSVWRYAWLLPLTAIPQFFMGQTGNSFGPDTSIGLLPMPTVLGYYVIFFGFGVFYFDADDQDGRVGRRWWIALPFALFVIFPMGLAAGSQRDVVSHGLSVFCQVAYAWLISFGMMGLFRWWLSSENKTMRYLSDSSYWLYLAHIPLIILVQYVVRDWSLPALVKFPIVCVVTSGLLLISYQLFVRYTPIGTLLNGPRRRSSMPEEPVDAIVLDAVCEESSLRAEPAGAGHSAINP